MIYLHNFQINTRKNSTDTFYQYTESEFFRLKFSDLKYSGKHADLIWLCSGRTESCCTSFSAQVLEKNKIQKLKNIQKCDPKRQCCGSVMLIPDSGSKNNNKREGEKIYYPTFFVATNITKLKHILYMNWRRKNLGQFAKKYRTFYPKYCH